MAWKRSPKSLVKLFYEVIPKHPLAEPRKMFGYPCCFVSGNMFTGLHQSNMILRLPAAERETFLTRYKTKLFKPFPDRTMREYVVVPKLLMQKKSELSRWLERSFKYAASLPAKK